VAGEIKTWGVEMSANVAITPDLSAHGNLTLQDPKASHFGSYQQGPKGDGTDDVLTITPNGAADNNPKIIARAGLEWRPIRNVSLFGEFSHIGKRAANANNAFYLPAYSTVDLGGSWNITDKTKVQLNVNNVFNQVGIVSWSRTGFLASLDRQGLTKAQYDRNGVYPVVPIQARAFFLTLSTKF
jgi:outer membrane receptor protein involved in Fe transport